LTFGTAQKLVNMSVKYLWVLGKIHGTPDQCAIDRNILKMLPAPWKDKSWQRMTRADYVNAIDAARIRTHKESLVYWELTTLNNREDAI
jgi:hypothetical protein